MFKKTNFLLLCIAIALFIHAGSVFASETTDIKPTFAYSGGNILPYEANQGEIVTFDVIIGYNSNQYNSFYVGFYVDDNLLDEQLMDMDSSREIITFKYTPNEIGNDTIKIVTDNRDEINEQGIYFGDSGYTEGPLEDNNTIEKSISIYGEASTFKVIEVTASIDYYVLDSSEQTISFLVKSKKDYDDGINNSKLNIYYLTDERYKNGDNFKTTEYEQSSLGSMIPVNTVYFGRQTTTIDEAGKNASFRTNLNNTKYHYIITDQYYDEIAINDKSKILYEGSFTTIEPINTNCGSDYEAIPNSFNINYLEGDEYKESRELYYAMVEFEYFKDLSLDLDNGKKVRHIIRNNTTNKTMGGEVFGYGLTRVKSKTGLYLTKDEFGNFFSNGENELEGIIDSLNAIPETNENNNTVTQILTLNNVDEVSDDVINVDGTIKSPGIKVVDSNGNIVNNTTNDTATDDNNSSEQDDNGSENNNTEVEVSKNTIEVKNTTMYSRLKGKIMLKVESVGEAYYVNPKTETMHYLGRPDDAFSVMREQGIGITNENLEKIPVGLGNLTGSDADGDGLPDLFEDAMGTDKNNRDTDGDGHNDKNELENSYNPNGSGVINADNNFSNAQKGKIFLQVQKNGEAWYINPNDGKRYFLGRPADAFQIMRNLGLGISNSDFESL